MTTFYTYFRWPVAVSAAVIVAATAWGAVRRGRFRADITEMSASRD